MRDLQPRLLPPEAHGAWAWSVEPPPDLFPEEAVHVAHAVPRRRHEFARGRGAARAALAAMGVPPVAVGSGPHREPLWPDGVVGSISHCSALAWAAVAPRSSVEALGIDVEPETALPEGVRIRVFDEEAGEGEALERATGLDTVGFGAKECIHKAVHPRTGVWLDFQDVRLTPSTEAGGLHAAPAHDGVDRRISALLERLEIRWAIHHGLVFTSAWIQTVRSPVQPEPR